MSNAVRERVLAVVRMADPERRGFAKASIVRTLSLSEEAVTQALMDLRRDQLVQFRCGGWYPREQKMLVPELGLVDSQRNRRWLAFVGYFKDTGRTQEEAYVCAWDVVRLWESTK